MSRFAVLVYSDFSLQEITCLTSALSVWFNEPIDFLTSENREYQSEEGLRIHFPTFRLPTMTVSFFRVRSIRFPRYTMSG